MRLRRLDVLRGVAVMLVLCRHHPAPESEVAAPVRMAGATLQQVGWIGVDLFFVLSGFLVSGLLFSEYRRHDTLRVGRFLVRRGFKIYPSFYLLLVVTWLMQCYGGDVTPANAPALFTHEAVYLQNYLGGVWNHTWSLAVEEHFYLVLPLVLIASVVPAAADPFRRAAFVLLSASLIVLALRILMVHEPYEFIAHLFPTHFRIDSLLWGALLGYAFHFRDRGWMGTLRRHPVITSLAIALLLAPAFVCEIGTSIFLGTWGLTSLALGFALVLACAITPPVRVVRSPTGLVSMGGGLVAAIGLDSYSIYLWHMPVQRWLMPPCQRLLSVQMWDPTLTYVVGLAAYVATAVVVGLISARMVERPALALRDRWVPSRAGLLAVAPVSERSGVVGVAAASTGS